MEQTAVISQGSVIISLKEYKELTDIIKAYEDGGTLLVFADPFNRKVRIRSNDSAVSELVIINKELGKIIDQYKDPDVILNIKRDFAKMTTREFRKWRKFFLRQMERTGHQP